MLQGFWVDLRDFGGRMSKKRDTRIVICKRQSNENFISSRKTSIHGEFSIKQNLET
jgi:hypothetical protein